MSHGINVQKQKPDFAVGDLSGNSEDDRQVNSPCVQIGIHENDCMKLETHDCEIHNMSVRASTFSGFRGNSGADKQINKPGRKSESKTRGLVHGLGMSLRTSSQTPN